MRKYQSVPDRIFDIGNITFMLLLGSTFIIPFYIVIVNAVTAEKFLTAGSINWFPQQFSTLPFETLFRGNSRIVTAFFVSVGSTLLGTMQGLTVITLFAYAMAKPKFPFKNAVMVLVVFTMMFSGGLIPTYLTFQSLGLTDTFYVLMIFNAFNAGFMIYIRNYFMSIPPSLPESAKLDGAGDLQIFLKIMLPLSKPMLAAMTLFLAVELYNDYTTPLFYTRNPDLETLQLLLKHVLTKVEALSSRAEQFLTKSDLPIEGIKSATVVITLAPIAVVYPFVQKYFISGVWTGAMKE